MRRPLHLVQHSGRLALAIAVAAGLALATQTSATAEPEHIDPAALPRGDNPAVAYLVRNTIRDGDLRVPAPKRGEHEALWAVAGGYLVRDYNVGDRSVVRVMFIDPAGMRRLVARSRQWIEVAVSASGRTAAVQTSLRGTNRRTTITVTAPATGRVIASREMPLATLAATTDRQVLVGRRARWHHPATVWWHFHRDKVKRIYHQAALSADVTHDRVVFDRTPVGEFCQRVALLSRPRRTLWESCSVAPHQWSPDGVHAVATRTYFDAAGTDRWWVIDGSTAQRQARVVGRLDWDAVWEDDEHFLTKAQSDDGKAAILRCDLSGSCERASKLWNVPLPSEPSLFYASPPVVLADR